MSNRARRRPGDCRAQLMTAARDLFLTRGYANTSVDGINARAGLSKGTFYHYFGSKADLLDAIVDELTDEGWRNTRQALEDRGGGAVARFMRFLAAARRWRIVTLPANAAVLRAALRRDNALLREKMRERSVRLAAPALAELIGDGVREGVFRVADPPAAARVFLMVAYGVSDDMVHQVASSALPDEELLASLVALGRAFMRSVEGLLGVPHQSLGEPEVELLAAMVRAFRAADESE